MGEWTNYPVFYLWAHRGLASFFIVLTAFNNINTEEGNDQESIQSSTTPDKQFLGKLKD